MSGGCSGRLRAASTRRARCSSSPIAAPACPCSREAPPVETRRGSDPGRVGPAGYGRDRLGTASSSNSSRGSSRQTIVYGPGLRSVTVWLRGRPPSRHTWRMRIGLAAAGFPIQAVRVDADVVQRRIAHVADEHAAGRPRSAEDTRRLRSVASREGGECETPAGRGAGRRGPRSELVPANDTPEDTSHLRAPAGVI